MEENKKDVLPLEGEPLTTPQISEPVVNALAAALNKIETYVPTQYINDGPPDIDAEHLNHAEQAIMRVTNLANGAADAISALQSQVTQLNSDLTDNLNHKKQILPWSNYRDGNYSISNFKFGSNLYIAVGTSSKVQKRCSIIAANDSIQIPHPEGFVTIVFNDTNHITVSGTTDNYQLREIRASDLFGI